MKVYTYSQARQHFAEVLHAAEMEEVIVKRRDGSVFSIVPKRMPGSPFDVAGVTTSATTVSYTHLTLPTKRIV